VEGFELSARKLGLEFGGAPASTTAGGEASGGGSSAIARLWVDIKTKLPVEIEFQQAEPVSGGLVRTSLDQFEWSVPLDAQLFVPEVPADMRIVCAEIPPANEETLLEGLKLYADTAGRFPFVLEPGRLIAELSVGLVRKGKGSATDPLSEELIRPSLVVAQACAFCQRLAQDGRAPEYFGATVMPDEPEGVLVRWPQIDGSTRVVYGDLSVKTLPAPQ
jgi:hypothetical protein